MKFVLTIDVPDAVKDQPTPKSMEELFTTLADHYRKLHEKKIPIKRTMVGIRENKDFESINIHLQSINVQGEV